MGHRNLLMNAIFITLVAQVGSLGIILLPSSLVSHINKYIQNRAPPPASHIFPGPSIQPLWPRWLPGPPIRPCCFHCTLLSIPGTTAEVTLLHLSHIGSILCSNPQWLLSLVALLDCPCRLPPCSVPDSSVPCGCPTHPAPGPLLCASVLEISTCLFPTPLRSQRPS